MRGDAIHVAATRRAGAGAPRPPTQLRIDRAAWTEATLLAGGKRSGLSTWEQVEVIAALRAWAQQHGRSPAQSDWHRCGPGYPGAGTVTRKLGPWPRALRKAGLPPAPPRQRHRPWSRPEALTSLRSWARRHGRSPRSGEWIRASPGRPCSATIRREFGRWEQALRAAGLEVPPIRPRQSSPWPRERIIQALRDWSAAQGRAPFAPDWVRSAPEHPCTATVYKYFGTWAAGLGAAGRLREQCRASQGFDADR